MKTLAINTASSTSAVAFLENGKPIAESTWSQQNSEAEMLMPQISDLLDGDYGQVDQILVVRGPGSFTGLRIGVATANTFAYLLQKPLYAIDAFQYWWKAFEGRDEKAALLIYAGGGGVYISHGEVGELYNLDQATDYLREQNIDKIFGDISPEQKEHFKEFEFLDLGEKFALTIAQFDLAKLESQKLVEPLYIKDPGITLSTKNPIK